MSDDWTDEDTINALIVEPLKPTDPLYLVTPFIDGVADQDPRAAAMVTPESLPWWGDFNQARNIILSIPGFAHGTENIPADGAPDVVYIRLLAGEPEYRIATGPGTRVMAGYLTLVWRPERGRWLIHRLAQDRIPPEDCPRTSPGSAPDYTRAP